MGPISGVPDLSFSHSAQRQLGTFLNLDLNCKLHPPPLIQVGSPTCRKLPKGAYAESDESRPGAEAQGMQAVVT